MNLGLRATRAVVVVLITFAVLASGGCATPKTQAAKKVHGGGAGETTQAELQQDIQRFTGVFLDRAAQAMETLTRSKRPEVREAGVRRSLQYATNSLDIATESSPELALLDMMVFVTLSRDAFDRYWIPTFFHEEGEPMARVLARAETEIWTIGSKVLTPKLQETLRALIARWQRENPDQYRVEGVRLGEFSKHAGTLARERAEEAKGLLSNVASGVQVGDQALLLSDRVLFLAQRMPFLLRMHAVLGSSEVLGALGNRLETDQALAKAAKAGADEARSLLMLAAQAAREARQLSESLYPLVLPRRHELGNYLASANSLALKTTALLTQLNATAPGVAEGVNRAATRLIVGLVAAGLLLVLAWWGGYFYVKRRLLLLSNEEARAERRPPGGKKAA